MHTPERLSPRYRTFQHSIRRICDPATAKSSFPERPESRDAIAGTTLEEAGAPGYFEGVLSADESPGEYRLVVEARLDGKPVRHVSTLAIEPYLGEFEGLGDARI